MKVGASSGFRMGYIRQNPTDLDEAPGIVEGAHSGAVKPPLFTSKLIEFLVSHKSSSAFSRQLSANSVGLTLNTFLIKRVSQNFVLVR